jgi:hypothetical protein
MLHQYISTSVHQYVTSHEYTGEWHTIIRDCLVMIKIRIINVWSIHMMVVAHWAHISIKTWLLQSCDVWWYQIKVTCMIWIQCTGSWSTASYVLYVPARDIRLVRLPSKFRLIWLLNLHTNQTQIVNRVKSCWMTSTNVLNAVEWGSGPLDIISYPRIEPFGLCTGGITYLLRHNMFMPCIRA